MNRFVNRSMENQGMASVKPVRIVIDSASQKLVTVRQIFSDDPAPQTQASAALRRSPLSSPAAAWPCEKVLLNPAPLSRRFSFSTSYHSKLFLSIPIFDFITFHNFSAAVSAILEQIALKHPLPCAFSLHLGAAMC